MEYEMTADKSKYLVRVDEMHRLRAQRDRLREALEWIADNYPRDDESVINQTARAALAATEDEK